MTTIQLVNDTASSNSSTIVSESSAAEVSTAQQWTIYAIVNGTTTVATAIGEGDLTITLSGSGDDVRISVKET